MAKRSQFQSLTEINITSLVDVVLCLLIIFMLTASIVSLNFVTDILLAVVDPRVRRGLF